MQLRLYHDPGSEFKTDPVNGEFEEVPELLTALEKAEGVEVQTIDTTGWTDQERREVYMQASVPSMWKKFRIGRVFGSRRYGGKEFARGVPALLVDQDGSRISPADVYPHEEQGGLITIADYLRTLLGK